MFYLIKEVQQARRGEFHTKHGVIQTPVFMNVGTIGTIKGGVATTDLQKIGTQVQLSNTYHLHVRPGEEVVYDLGGLHRFMNWNKPILTDSGGFQVFSLAKLRTIQEEGVYFNSHIDGRKIFMGPEESMGIQSKLASTIAMAFDECVENPATYSYAKDSILRTTRWLERCRKELDRLNGLETTINPHQLLFGINQGATFSDLRVEHMKQIREIPCEGYAIGGLAVGEPTQVMYDMIEAVEPYMPKEKPRYLMGVGTPINIVEAVARGVDFFDCVMPSRNARHGHLFTAKGILNLMNAKFERSEEPIEEGCDCEACQHYSRGYIRHLFKAKEVLALRLSTLHNLRFYNRLMEQIRESLEQGTFQSFRIMVNEEFGKKL